ncbi:Rpn family recombination-promoting nuclease/putative transposase [Candidatus Thiosymbion oneisti]|uniref:Rpn family recombination-promoting nuclease/putative transposase n=1 Tax=Candidatus Thiosymbion oneisti TaxID=589554 RepID=UPI000B1F3CAB|nr:Rpn family recombination-promoting nuclease/putative transposase [Candidatus Thiosymbion oneisti]
MNKRKLVSFDWALKRLLRSKANYEVLEGFLSELLKEDIEILEILESESNRDSARDKSNRVDMKVRNRKQEIILIEIQYEREFDYLQRILFATAKAITEHIAEAEPYANIVKVISINILYFDLGHGEDYVYHGKTQFRGIHYHDELRLNNKQQELFGKQYPHELYPEYYLLKVNQFDDVARDSLDEWIYFLKNGEIAEGFRAKGLARAKEILDIMHLGEEERRSYEWHREELRYQASMYRSSFFDGRMEGKKEGLEKGIEKGIEKGREEGMEKGKKATAKIMKQAGEPMEKIMQYTQLTPEEVEAL